MIENKTYYFSKADNKYGEVTEESLTPNWTEPYYLRIRVDTRDMEIKFEDTCGRMVPVCFDQLHEMRDTLTKIITTLQQELIGEPKGYYD